VVVEEYDSLILLRSATDAPPDGVAELAGFLADETARGVFTIVVGAGGVNAALWTRLGTVLDSLCERGVTTIRLVLPGAGAERPDRPAAAQRIADAWGVEVVAPEAGVMIVPGGSLFARGPVAPGHGWRSFTPGARPAPLGPRVPAPLWQPALTRLPGRTAGGWVVEQVPAGILVRPAQARGARAGDLCFAVPVDDHHLAVLVDTGEAFGDMDIPAGDIAGLLAALPGPTRSAVRLAPCGPVDLLPVAQDTAERLGAEVEVLTGLPLIVGAAAEPVVRPVLVGAGAEPTWAPFVEAVACRPYGADGRNIVSPPRLVRWRSPVPDAGRTGEGAVPLSDRWQVSVTRAGLVVGPRGEVPALAGRPVSSMQLAVEVDLRSAPADDALFAGLSRLLSALGTGVGEFVTLYRVLPSHRSDDQDFRLLRLAIEHGVSLAEPPPAETPQVPASPNVRTGAIPRAGTAREVTGRPAARPPAVRAGSTAPAARGFTTPAIDGSTMPVADSTHQPTPVVPPASAGERPARPGHAGRTPHDGGRKLLPPSPGKVPPTSGTPTTPRSPGTAAEIAAEPPTSVAPPAPPAPSAAPPAPAARSAPAGPSPRGPAGSPSAAAPPGEVGPPSTPIPPSSGPVVSSTPRSAPSTAVRPETDAARESRPRTKSVRRSTEAERADFRSLAQPVWERHSASVNRAMTRMPALRGTQVDAARTDLVAVHIYLSGGHAELNRRPEEHAPGIPACYSACLAAGLCRLPSYRGVAVHGGLPADGGLERYVPGAMLREQGPVSALPIGVAAGLTAATGGYVIWSATGRRVRPLLGAAPDEVVFPPGTAFRVLDVRSTGPAPIVLLSEVLGGGPGIDDRPGGLCDADRATLERLDEALRREKLPAGGTSLATWPARCAEPLDEGTGQHGAPSASAI
jgi:hypothetical protein